MLFLKNVHLRSNWRKAEMAKGTARLALLISTVYSSPLSVVFLVPFTYRDISTGAVMTPSE